jgi:HlyD family secretion protein
VVVETGISDDNFLEIKSGLKEGDEVISGSYRAISRELEDGSIVRVEDKKGGPGNQDMVAEEEN